MTKCKNNRCKRKTRASNSFSIGSLLIIALLPKCPFCVMAYSGAVSLCSGKMLFPNSGSSSIYIFGALCSLVLLAIAFNYRGKRTFVSFILAILGSLLVIGSQYFLWESGHFYTGVMMLLFASWHNGSFYSILRNTYIEKYLTSKNMNK